MAEKKGISWRYAIGELLIVTVGISLAFWLNNWSESRKDKDLAQEYLINLKEDLTRDIDTLGQRVESVGERLKFANSYIMAIYRPDLRHDSISTRIYQVASNEAFVEHEATYKTLINSGDIRLIRNLALRTAIIDQYNIYEKVHFQEDVYTNYMASYLGPFMIKNYSYARRMHSKVDPWTNDELMNLVFSAYGILSKNQAVYNKARESAEHLVALIDEELNGES